MPADFAELYGIQASDVMALNEASERNGVFSGLAVSPGTGLTVDVASGIAKSGGAMRNFASTTNVALAAADTTDPRKDLIVINAAGSIVKRDGVAAAADPPASIRRLTFNPSPPDLVAGDTVLAEVWVEANEVGPLLAAEISDRRVIIISPAKVPDYFVFTEASVTYAINGKTGLPQFSDPSAGVVLQAALDNLPSTGGAVILDVGFSWLGTVTIDTVLEEVFLGSLLHHQDTSANPQVNKIVLDTTAGGITDITIAGIRIDELVFDAVGIGNRISRVLVKDCAINARTTANNLGVIFNSTNSYVELVTFERCKFQLAGTNTIGVEFNGGNPATGHINFLDCHAIIDGAAVDNIFFLVKTNARIGPPVRFSDFSFVNFGNGTNFIEMQSHSVADSGVRDIIIKDLQYESDDFNSTVIEIASSTAAAEFNATIDNLHVVSDGAIVNQLLNNLNSTWRTSFPQGVHLRGGHQTGTGTFNLGTTNESADFRVTARYFRGGAFSENPQIAVLTPLGATIDTGAAGPAKTQIDGTNFAYFVLEYDAAATESAFWTFSLPNDYAVQDIRFIVRWLSVAETAGDVVWASASLGRQENEAWDAALSADVTATDTTSGTAGQINETIITMTPAQHGLVAGDAVVVAIRRIGGDGGDTLVGDARFIECLVEI